MPVTQSSPATTTTLGRIIPLSELRESPRNPRKTFNPVALQELAASMRTVGVITPLLARPVAGGGYEIAAGHRRRRAAELAGLTEVPVIVREMDDATFLEVLTVENLQREDVAPLEEADGYRLLIDSRRSARGADGPDTRREDVERVAQKIGKSVSYVYQRLKLLELTKAARRRLEEGVLTPGHAILIARLVPGDQEKALDFCVYKNYHQGGTSTRPVRELAGWIRQVLHCDLSAAPFKKEDASLLPQAGACTTCPKRARNNPDLHSEADPKKDICTDPTCFQEKRVAFVERRCQQGGLRRLSCSWSPIRKDGVLVMSQVAVLAGRSDGCSSSETAIMVDGPDLGQTVKICSDPKCGLHAPRYKTSNAWRDDERERQRKAKAERARRELALRETLAKVTGPLPRAALELVVLSYWKGLWQELQKRLAAFWAFESTETGSVSKKVAALSDNDLAHLLISMAVARDLNVGPYDSGKPEGLNAMAKVFGVDASKMRAKLASPAKTAKSRKAAVQTSAPRVAGGGGAAL